MMHSSAEDLDGKEAKAEAINEVTTIASSHSTAGKLFQNEICQG